MALARYKCKPELNTSCDKTDCYMYGGKCFTTEDEECALRDYIDTDCGRVDTTPKKTHTMSIIVDTNLDEVEAQLDRINEKMLRINAYLNDIQAVFGCTNDLLGPPMTKVPD